MPISTEAQPRRSFHMPGPVSHRVIAWVAFGAGAALVPAAAVAQVPAPVVAQSPDTVVVPGVSVTAPPPTEGYKSDFASSPKYTAPLLDTPRAVTVIPQEVIRDRGSASLQDVLRTVPGITFGSGEGGNPIGDRPFIRGFDSMSDTFVDGIRDPGSQQRETFNLESVEVSKGPGSSYTGRGSTGGSINLVSKTPKLENFAIGSVTLGSSDYKRATADGNYKLGEGMALRLNVMAHDQDVAGRDEVFQRRWGFAPSLAIGLDGPTRAIFSLYHVQSKGMPDYGHPFDPRTGRPVETGRDTFYGLAERDFQRQQVDAGTIRLEHDFSDNLTLRNTSRYSWSTNDYIVTNPDDNRGNVVKGLVWRSPKTRNADTTAIVNQTDLSGSFTTYGMKNTFAAGLEFSSEKVRNRGYTVPSGNSDCAIEGLLTFNCTTVGNPNPGDPWRGAITPAAAFTHTTTKTAAAYAFDTIEINRQLSVTAGLRFDNYDTTSSTATAKLKNESSFVNYMVGVVYKPIPEASIYFTHGTSSNPSGENAGEGTLSVSATNQSLDPERNRTYELGAKWDVLDRKLSLSGAIFQIEKDNARVNDPLGGPQLLIGEQRVRGFELGAAGQITKEWKIFAGYTYLDAKIVDDGPAAANDGNKFPSTPEHSFSLWSTYDILPRLTIGGGAFYVSKRFADAANTKYVPSYWRFDAMASYHLTDNVDLRLNILNITDKLYYDQLHPVHFATVAPGRTVLLTADVRF